MTYEQGKQPPSYDATFERLAISDDFTFRGGEFVGKNFPLEVKLHVHPNTNGIIVINYPGVAGDIDGYENKYKKLGDFVQQTIGAVLRTDNPHYAGFRYENSVQDHLEAVIDYGLQHSQEISGKDPDGVSVYLMGFSAGASGIAAVAYKYPQVKKMLLMAPSGDAGQEAVTKGLQKYNGECHIVIGQNDEVVGTEAGTFFASLATAASVVRSVVIPDCDHQFRGEINGRIMSAAPLWAFSNIGGEIPSPVDGITLYT